MTHHRKTLRAPLIALALSLSLAACNSADEGADSQVRSEAIAPIPAPEGTDWAEKVSVTREGGYLIGNPDAPLKLVEFASHTCGHCAEFAETAGKELKQKYIPTGVVSLELRNLVRDPIDLTIAALVRCGQAENMPALSDQAWVALEDIFQTVQNNASRYEAAAELPPEQRFIAIAESAGLIDFFAARGLSRDQARACLADAGKIEEIARRSQQQAQELEINATPTLMLNGRKIDAATWSQLEPILQRAGARAQ